MFEQNISLYSNSGNMKTQMQDTVSVAMLHSRDRAQSKEKEGIHSGHFMLSRVHDNKTGDYLSDEDDIEPIDGFNFSDASKDTCTTYKFGPRSTQTLTLDASLSTLFEHLTLAYKYKHIFCLFVQVIYFNLIQCIIHNTEDMAYSDI